MTDIALLPCPHCGGKEHEIGVGGAGHSITCHSFSCRSSTGRWHTREQAIAAWNRRTSPSQVAPANPAQVTDAMVNMALNAFDDGVGDPNDYNRRMRKALEAAFALTAAIGAGGQAADDAGAKLAKAMWGVDLVPSALSHPHPADERVMEALRRLVERAQELISRSTYVNWHDEAVKALSAKEGR